MSTDCRLVCHYHIPHPNGQRTDLSPDSSFARSTDASAGDSSENVKLGSSYRGIYRLFVNHLDHLPAPRVE